MTTSTNVDRRSGLFASISACTLALTAITSSVASTADHADFPRNLSAFIDELRAGGQTPPGFVVVAVHGADTVFEQAYGTRNAASREPLTLDTPVYNASTTKAYTGLLAAILDEEHLLSLDATLKDVWPDFPPTSTFDPAAVRARMLLAHASGIHEGGVQFRSNGTGDITAAEVPRRLAAYAVKREPGFRYANFGPYVWSTMMEAKLGVAWRDMIAREVFKPLDLTRTSARLEDFSAQEVAHCHARMQGRWEALRFKPTPILNAAGGIYTSGRDSGRFLKAFLTEGKSAQGRVPSAALRASWQRVSVQDRDFFGLHRDGYGLGWDLGTYDEHRFVARSGGAAGCRSLILFLPDEGFGIAALSLGDAGANALGTSIVKQAIDFWTSRPDARQRASARVAEYASAAKEGLKTADTVDPRLQRRIGLDADAARASAGVYENERLGRFTIAAGNDVLTISGGVFAATLVPIAKDELLIAQPGDEPEKFHLIRGATGSVIAFVWDDDRYDRRTD